MIGLDFIKFGLQGAEIWHFENDLFPYKSSKSRQPKDIEICQRILYVGMSVCLSVCSQDLENGANDFPEVMQGALVQYSHTSEKKIVTNPVLVWSEMAK